MGWNSQGSSPRVGETCSEPGKMGRIWKAKQKGAKDKEMCLMGAEGGKAETEVVRKM